MISSSFFSSSSSSTSSVRNFFALSLLSVAVLVLALGHFSTSAEAYPLNLGGGGGNEAMARKHPVALEIENPEEVLSVLDNLMQNILVGIDISHSGLHSVLPLSPSNYLFSINSHRLIFLIHMFICFSPYYRDHRRYFCSLCVSLASTPTTGTMPSNDVEFLNQLCQQLYDDKTWERFRFCKLIRLCLSGHKNIDAIKNDAWAKLLRDAVNEMFCSRLFGEFRDEAFNLAGQMTLTFGNVDWIKCEATWNQNNSEFLILLLQLVSIEVRVVLPRLLEEKPPHWVNPEFGSTFILMEKLLLAFINNVNNDDEIALKTQDLLKINAAQIIRTIEEVRSTMIEVVAFIKAISLKTDPLPENFQNLLYAAIRILCVYMAEEPERMNPEICEVLKFILNTMKNSGHMFHINVIPIVKFFYCDDETMEHLQRGGINYDTIEEDFS